MREKLPFENLFEPLVQKAGAMLRAQMAGAAQGLLTAEAYAGWDRYLLSRLTRAGAKAADWQFQIFKSVRGAFPKNHSATSHSHSADVLYHEFLGPKPELQLNKLLREFPALATLCDILIENWLSAITEFLECLSTDCNKLGAHFKTELYICPVTVIQAGLSDPHRGGRCVVRLGFSNGARLIYKPRSLAPEAHFSLLLDHLNSRGMLPPLRSARCWNRVNYGWMENIEQAPCKNSADVHAFYQRAGMLLGLVYLARGVDFHRENLIAAGECPVLIDLETLWHPQELLGSSACGVATSVVRTGFLPQTNSRLGKRYDWGALSRFVDEKSVAGNSNSVYQEQSVYLMGKQSVGKHEHLPAFEGKPVAAFDYIVDIQEGFKQIGEQLISGVKVSEEFKGWLRILADCPRRRIPHPTARYYEGLKRLTSLQFLRQRWSEPNVATELRQGGFIELAGELQAAMQLDVPYFEQAQKNWEPVAFLPTRQEFLEQISTISEAIDDSSSMADDLRIQPQNHHGGTTEQMIS